MHILYNNCDIILNMKICVLSSSSSGNCVYLEVDNRSYLLDCGISSRQIELKLNSIGVNPNRIKGIFITHEHSDHVSGLSSFFKKYNPTIYLTKGTYKGLKDQDKQAISPIYCKFVKSMEEFKVDNLSILPFPLSHDVIEPTGFKFTYNDKSIAYITDTGVFDYIEELHNLDLYILESNHEPDLLMLSNRPWPLKNRIMSDTGHLSNQSSAIIFSKLMGERTKTLFLFHLSNECNTKELAKLSYETYFNKNNLSLDNIKIVVTDRTIPTEVVEI